MSMRLKLIKQQKEDLVYEIISLSYSISTKLYDSVLPALQDNNLTKITNYLGYDYFLTDDLLFPNQKNLDCKIPELLIPEESDFLRYALNHDCKRITTAYFRFLIPKISFDSKSQALPVFTDTYKFILSKNCKIPKKLTDVIINTLNSSTYSLQLGKFNKGYIIPNTNFLT